MFLRPKTIFIVGLLMCAAWLITASHPSGKLFPNGILRLPTSSGDMSFETNDFGRTWDVKRSNNTIYTFYSCVFQNIERSSVYIGGHDRQEIPLSSLPTTIQNVAANGGICYVNPENGDVFIYIEKKVQNLKYKAILIGYNAGIKSQFPSGLVSGAYWNSWTLRPIKGQPFLGDLFQAFSLQTLDVLLIRLFVPPIPLLHLFLMMLVLFSIYPVEKWPEICLGAIAITFFTFLIFAAAQHFFNQGANFSLLMIAATMINFVVLVFIGCDAARVQQFSENFQHQFGFIFGLIGCVVPLCWIAGWWSWTFLIVALYSFLYFRHTLYQYMEIQGGYKASSWVIDKHLLQLAGTAPLVATVFFLLIIPLTSSLINWGSEGNVAKIVFYAVVGILLFMMNRDIAKKIFERFPFDSNKKKQEQNALSFKELEMWKKRKLQIWARGLILILILLWLTQYGAYLINNALFGAIILR